MAIIKKTVSLENTYIELVNGKKFRKACTIYHTNRNRKTV